MELRIISPSEDGFVTSIEFNHEELKAELEERLQKYQGLVYTEETVTEAKKDRASLNKFKKALNDKRLEIKRQCMAPLEEFEAKVKELVSMVEEPVREIDAQVKGFEEQKREKKRAGIEAFWNQQKSNVKTLVSLDRIFNPRWLNATFPTAKIEEEINEFLAKAESDIALIEGLETEFEDQVIRVYLQQFDVGKAMAENKFLLEQKAKREEYRRQQEEAKAARKKAKAESVTESPAADPAPKTAPKPKAPEAEAAQVQQIDFRVWATTEQLGKLKAFLLESGIKYGPVHHEQRKQAA